MRRTTLRCWPLWPGDEVQRSAEEEVTPITAGLATLIGAERRLARAAATPIEEAWLLARAAPWRTGALLPWDRAAESPTGVAPLSSETPSWSGVSIDRMAPPGGLARQWLQAPPSALLRRLARRYGQERRRSRAIAGTTPTKAKRRASGTSARRE